MLAISWSPPLHFSLPKTPLTILDFQTTHKSLNACFAWSDRKWQKDPTFNVFLMRWDVDRAIEEIGEHLLLKINRNRNWVLGFLCSISLFSSLKLYGPRKTRTREEREGYLVLKIDTNRIRVLGFLCSVSLFLLSKLYGPRNTQTQEALPRLERK